MLGLDALGLIMASGAASAVLTGVSMVACRKLRVGLTRVGGVQSVHRHWAPRIGGLPIFITLALGIGLWTGMHQRELAALLLVSALPAFIAGFVEDLNNRVGPRVRLLATFVSAWVAWFLIGGQLTRVDVPGFDWLLQHVWLFAFAFTAFAVGGIAHSINIIDGFNGLSTFFCVICFAALYIVSSIVGDPLVQGLSLLFCGALLGFLVWNFPFGRVFLGDSGAYFLGFALGELSVLLVARNPEVSPWFCFLLLAYPIWDTLFSSYRREVKRRVSWSAADALHLHHLIYRRLVRPFSQDGDSDRVVPNSLTSVYVWMLGLLCAVPAVFFWYSTPVLVVFSVIFCTTYGLLYRRLAKFRAPRLLVLPKRRAARPAVDVLPLK